MGYFEVGIRFKNCFGVYSYGATTFIFYVSFNSDTSFVLNFGVVLALGALMGFLLGQRIFFGVKMGYFRAWGEAKNLFWVIL